MSGAYLKADATVAAHNAIAITLSDTTYVNSTRGLYIGGSGNLKVTMVDGGVVTFSNLISGTILPIQVNKCWLTGSTATLVLALY